jgi:hypothetical protein
MVQEGLGITIATKRDILSLPEQVVSRELKPNTFREINVAVLDTKATSKATDAFIQTARALFTDEDA